MDFNDIKLNIEDIEDQVVSKVVRHLLEDIGRDLRKEISTEVRAAISTKVNEVVGETLEEGYQPIDNYGDPTGEKTTIREMFKTAVSNWWKIYVDKDGKETGSNYSGKPRIDHIAEKTLEELLKGQFKVGFEDVVKEIKAETKKSIFAILNKAVDKAWK